MSDHQYISTACQHNLCDHCREVCKFCSAPCQHHCHVVPEPDLIVKDA